VPELPIIRSREHLLSAARKGRRIVISSPPGSGKSTKVPQLLLDSGRIKGKIAVLEPRRLAARMLAERVAKERGGAAGGEVGYRVRFEDRTGKSTRIIFETEGILLRELVDDPSLTSYSAVILDEFHERHLHGDMALAVCMALQEKLRPDLLLIAMSATLDEKTLAAHMAPCETVLASGTVFPVRQLYCDEDTAKLPPWDAAAKTCAALLPGTENGHALVFMPGAYEIGRTVSALSAMPALSGFRVMPLHGDMPPGEQDAALAPSSARKIIVATNIAETSLTIEGVTAIIDNGLAKVARYDGARGINTLFTEKIPAPSAAQRAGRAGRTAPGVCVRLWTERENPYRPLGLEPEILRLDLSEALLTLKACGLEGFHSLGWLDRPEPEAVERAEKLLANLGATDGAGKLTETGREMSGYPLHPRYSRMMVEAKKRNCTYECAAIAAVAQGRGIWQDDGRAAGRFQGRDGFRSDFKSVIMALDFSRSCSFDPHSCRQAGIRHTAAAEACKAARRLARDAKPSGKIEEAARCFLLAFPDRVAAALPGASGRYQLPGGRRAALDVKSDAAGAPVICAGEALERSGKGGTDITLSFATEIKEEWLQAAFPAAMSRISRPALDRDTLTPVTEILTNYLDITVRREISTAAKGKPSSDLIAEEFISGRERFQHWDDEVEEWLARVEFLSQACPDFGISPLGEEDLKLVMADVCDGAKSVSEARGRQILPVLQNWFGWDKNQLIEKYAPTRLQLPGAHRKARIRYPKGREPYLEAKIQDLFPLNETPKIAAGRVPLVIHILAPSMRPVQVTKDLRSFWVESYPKLKPQLSRRYPKHKWL